MKKYQIQCTDSKGCGHFLYFSTAYTDGIDEVAAEVANADIEKRIENQKYNPFGGINLARVLKVVEYDEVKKEAIKKPILAKLYLNKAKVNGHTFYSYS